MMQTKGIAAVSVVAGLVAVTIMALVTRIFMAKAKHTTTDDKSATDGKAEQAQQLAHIYKSWKRLVKPKQDQNIGHWVPSFSSIIKAGDEGLITSALFANLHGRPGEPLLETLYDVFANELRARSAAERSSYPGDMTRFLARTKRPASTIGRSKSTSHTRRTEPSLKTHRKSLDLSVMEMGLARGLSVKKPAAALVPMRNGLEDDGGHKHAQNPWMKDGQTAKYQDGNMNVRITPNELAALSILLGSQVNVDRPTQDTSNDPGAYGISIRMQSGESGKSNVTLHQHKLRVSQRHATGSGVSPLFAKHLFCGSLPYTQDKLGVHSMLIDHETLEAIKTGASLSTHPYIARTPQSKYLESLPSSREPRFHILATSGSEINPPGTLLDAIAALPFSGGLAPLASAPLISTVRFVASAGLSPARLLQRLEGLVDKVHRHSPQIDIFGQLYEVQHAGLLYRERERLGKLAHDESGRRKDTVAHKSARMSRYVTMLERLMALVPDVKPRDVVEVVKEAMKLELSRSYERAVAAYANTASGTPPLGIDTIHPASRSPRLPSSNRSSLGSATSPSSSKEFPAENLARQVEHVLKSDLPFDIPTIAFVSRMVLVEWTLSVQRVGWEGEGGGGWKVEGLEDLGGRWGKMGIS